MGMFIGMGCLDFKRKDSWMDFSHFVAVVYVVGNEGK